MPVPESICICLAFEPVFRLLVNYDLIVDENLGELAILYRLVGTSTAPPK